MSRFFVLRPRDGLGARVPDAFTLHAGGHTTSHRTGLVERGFETLELALSEYGLTEGDLEEVDELPKFSQRH